MVSNFFTFFPPSSHQDFFPMYGTCQLVNCSYLNCPLEELDGILMLLEVRETIAGGTPSLRRELVDFREVLGQT